MLRFKHLHLVFLTVSLLSILSCSEGPNDEEACKSGKCEEGIQSGKKPLDSLMGGLYDTIRAEQVIDDTPFYRSGSWPVSLHLAQLGGFDWPEGIAPTFYETNAFLVLKQSLILRELSLEYELPGVNEVIERSQVAIDRYLAEADATHEPYGTINYYPIIRERGGIRGITGAKYIDPLKWLNLPNDVDDSSWMCHWSLETGQEDELKFCEAFVDVIGEYRDLNRPLQHPSSKRWKEPNTGAFLTWVDSELSEESRMPPASLDGLHLNDVDCVVNMNVLSAVAAYQEAYPDRELSYNTAQGVNASCDLVNMAVEKQHTAQCSPYYDKNSQFLSVYARAYKKGATCLEPSLDQATRLTLHEARLAKSQIESEKPDDIDWLGVADVIQAMKDFYPVSERTEEVKGLIVALSRGLEDKGLTVRPGSNGKSQLFLRSDDSLFYGVMFGIRMDWTSKAASVGTALHALLTP